MVEEGANCKITKFADGTEWLSICKIYTTSEKVQTCVPLLNVGTKAADKIYPQEKNNALNEQVIIYSKLATAIWQGKFERIIFW